MRPIDSPSTNVAAGLKAVAKKKTSGKKKFKSFNKYKGDNAYFYNYYTEKDKHHQYPDDRSSPYLASPEFPKMVPPPVGKKKIPKKTAVPSPRILKA
jgi:hypothetical protein